MDLCLGTYGDPRGVGVSYEPGNHVVATDSNGSNRLRGYWGGPVAHPTNFISKHLQTYFKENHHTEPIFISNIKAIETWVYTLSVFD